MKHLINKPQKVMKSIEEFNKIVKNYMTMIRILTASVIILISFNCFSQYQYLGSGAATTKLLLHMNGNSKDVSGNGNNGTDSLITYGLNYGKFNQGALFNGTSSKIKITDNASLKPTGNFTFGCWIKTTYKTTDSYFFQSFSQNPNRAGFFSRIAATIGRNVFVIGKNSGTVMGTDWTQVVSTTDLTDNKWHLIINVWDGVNLIIYIDGNFDNSIAGIGNAVYNTTNYVRVGNRNQTGTDTMFYNGNLDETFLDINKVWTSSEIKQYYTYSKGWFLGLNEIEKHDIKYLNWFIPSQNLA